MEGTRPMDRLLVGDVGLRQDRNRPCVAAFKAVQSQRQVAVLVPTTILADQHLRTFTERLADFPDARRGDEPLSVGQGAGGGDRRAQGREGRHRHRHASALEPPMSRSRISD